MKRKVLQTKTVRVFSSDVNDVIELIKYYEALDWNLESVERFGGVAKLTLTKE